MQRWILIGAFVVLILAAGAIQPVAVRAQTDGETPLPPCTPEDYAPLTEVLIGMMDMLQAQAVPSAEAMLEWRATIDALDLHNCAGLLEALLQLRLASDELLIGALLLERGPDNAEQAAGALNIGLTNLVNLRFVLPGAGADPDAPADSPATSFIGALSGDDVLAAFEAADLPLAGIQRNAGPAGRGAPRTEAERITFSLPTAFDGGVGQVLIFADVGARNAWLSYLFGGSLPDPGHIWVRENVVMQLSSELDLSTARAFRRALDSAGS